VDNLKKISLILESGTAPDKMNLTKHPVRYEFIFGTGSEGITPFEYEMINKSIGDEIVIHVRLDEIPSKFEHMAHFITEHVETKDSFYLKVKIENISASDNREIVKALAANVRHEAGCDCGCGCEGH
jgi:hypothetical protein